MILLKPDIPNQVIKVFVRKEYPQYDVKLVDAQTQIVTEYVSIPTVSEGIAEIIIPPELTAKSWYNLLVFYDDVLQNYTMIYCDTDTDQRYSNLKEFYDIPEGGEPEYVLPKSN